MESVVEENESNAAGYQEIEGHVRILGAKLSQLTQSNSTASQTLEDLQDYYERGLQLRVYRIQTLEEMLKEEKTARMLFRQQVHHAFWAIVAALVAAYAVWNPATAISLVKQSWSYLLVIAATIYAVQLKL